MPELKDWLTIIALLLGPAVGVWIAQNLQNRRVRLEQKRSIFFTLVSTRQEIYAADRIRALNMIDVAFHRDEKVRTAWSELFKALNNRPENIEANELKRKSIELLSAMAKSLGYHSISQMDIDRWYLPIGVSNAAAQTAELQTQVAVFIKTLNSFMSRTVPTPENVTPGQPVSEAKTE